MKFGFDLEAFRPELKAFCKERSLKGTITLSDEGINLSLAGEPDQVREVLKFVEAKIEAPLEVRESWTNLPPFRRMNVKYKPQIVPSTKKIAASSSHESYLSPEEFKKLRDSGEEIVLLDVRNSYEHSFGTFEGSIDPKTKHFREFEQRAKHFPDDWKKQKLVMFCTGGIRCEKAAPILEKLGFEKIFQLKGGILKYFEEIGKDHYRGECFVFDSRVSVDSKLQTDVGDDPQPMEIGFPNLDAETFRLSSDRPVKIETQG